MSAASPGTTRRPSARERILAAAGELFYAEGVHTVGVDRLIEHAGVAKASLYSSFGSKESLIRAYLEDWQERRRTRITAGLERFGTPRERLLGVFDLLAEQAVLPTFRGCAFYNAVAEGDKEGEAAEIVAAARAWNRELFGQLAAEAGARDPQALAGQLVVLYDGASAGSRLEHGPGPALTSRGIAAALLDAATA